MMLEGVNQTELELMHQLYPNNPYVELEIVRRRRKASAKEQKELTKKMRKLTRRVKRLDRAE